MCKKVYILKAKTIIEDLHKIKMAVPDHRKSGLNADEFVIKQEVKTERTEKSVRSRKRR